MSAELVTNSVAVGMIGLSIVGAVVLAGFTNTTKVLYKEDRNLTILFSIVFLAMIGIVFSGFLDVSMQFAGTPDNRTDVAKAICTAVGIACSIVFVFFLISIFILRSDPSRTQHFTSTLMYLSFLLSFISISVMSIQKIPSAYKRIPSILC
jgi:uncharacterized membrane protein